MQIEYEGQYVTVDVFNHLSSEEMTINWHGIHQRVLQYLKRQLFLADNSDTSSRPIHQVPIGITRILELKELMASLML